jgi:hypothetical protein
MIYPRPGAIVSLLAIVFAAAASTRFVRGEDQPTSIASSDAESHSGQTSAEAAIQEALDRKVDLELDEIPLTEAIGQIKQKYQLPIQLDLAALKSAGIDPAASRVAINVHRITLRSALRLLLGQCNLTYIFSDDILRATSIEQANSTLNTVVYDVRDLLSAENVGQPDTTGLVKLLRDCVDPPSWSEQGGPATCEPGPLGTLIVAQTQDCHEGIENLLAALRRAKQRSQSGGVQSVIDVGSIIAIKKVEKLLDDKIDENFQRRPLSDIIEGLRKQKGLDVVIDQAALKEAGMDLNGTEVTYGGNGLALRSALKLALAQLNLTMVVEHEVLLVTTKAKADEALTFSLYPIEDLLPKSGDSTAIADSTDVVKLIASDIERSIGSTSWNGQGGNGSLTIWGQDHPILVIFQTQENHEQIALVLNRLREVLHQREAEAAAQPAKVAEPESIVLRVYDLRVSGPSGPAMTPQEVADLVKALVEPKSWSQPDVFVRGVTGKLVVKQVPSLHRQIEKLLDQLGASVPTTASKPPAANAGGGF